jgi:cyclohexanone monooxygenase
VKTLKPGWHQYRMDNFNALVSGVPQTENLVNDGWTELISKLIVGLQQGRATDMSSPEAIARAVELADFEKMEGIRARVDATVKDPRIAEALKPYYRQFCKRPCFHNEYLETFNRPNVTLVDTKGKGVDRVTKKGVVVGGQEYEVDCLIYASGFEVGTDYSRRAGLTMIGRSGATLAEKWSTGIRTVHGMHVRDFPNAFIMSNPQAGFTASYPHLLDEQAKHIAYILTNERAKSARTIEASEAGEDAWVKQCIAKARNVGDFFENCTPGYYNNEGKPAERSLRNSNYGAGSVKFIELLEQWRADGALAGLELSSRPDL